jgi:hypothetical protein
MMMMMQQHSNRCNQTDNETWLQMHIKLLCRLQQSHGFSANRESAHT